MVDVALVKVYRNLRFPKWKSGWISRDEAVNIFSDSSLNTYI